MTHQTNKQFNTYKEGLDLEFFDTQSNYVDYLWEVLNGAQNEAWSIVITI